MTKAMAIGETVVARADGDVARICRLISVRGDIAYITDNTGLVEYLEQGETWRMTAFRLSELYRMDERVTDSAVLDWDGLVVLTC